MKHISEFVDVSATVKPEPIKTGFRFLDNTIGGYYPGEVTTLCGFEDSGKTAFVITQINRIAVDHNIPTLLVLDNLNLEIFIALMATYYCGINTNNIHSVLTSPLYRDSVGDYLEKLKAAPLYIWDEDFFSKGGIKVSAIKDIVKEHNIRIIFFDEPINCYANEIIEPGKDLKKMALETNVPIVSTCCIYKSVTTEISAEISLSDYWSCGGYHGSDVIISITDFEKLRFYSDAKGRKLKGIIQLKVIKYKGEIQQKRGYFERQVLLMRKATIERKKMKLMEESLGDNVLLKNLIEDLELDIIEDEGLKDECI